MALAPYIPTQWVNGTAPAINAVNLNHVGNGVKDVTDAVIVLEQTVAENTPVGMITLFSGATVPTGWALCDGTLGTPNLVDKFILGGNIVDIGDTGGSADAVNVSHSHTFTGNALAPHKHTYTKFSAISQVQFTASAVYGVNTAGITEDTSSVSAGTPSGTVNASGESGVGKNMPPYYTLAYIMKTA